jgi:lysophospholipase L1-like esterase
MHLRRFSSRAWLLFAAFSFHACTGATGPAFPASPHQDGAVQVPEDGATKPGRGDGSADAPDAAPTDGAVPDMPDAAERDAGHRDAAVPLKPLVSYAGGGARRGFAADNGELNIGHQFKVTQAGIVVRELGIWDEGANGLAEAHTVTLFALDQPGNAAQATAVPGGSVVVPQGTAAELEQGFRFAKLAAPLALPQGDYAVIAYGMDANDAYGDGGSLPLSDTGVEHGAFVPYQFVAAASPAFPAGGDMGNTVSVSFRYESQHMPVLKILPIGDSITFGVGGSNAGYRPALRTLLRAAGVDFQYVGSSIDFPGDLPGDQRHHEGHPGWVITRGSSGRDGLTDYLPTWLGPTGVRPDVLLLMIGTNDVDLDYDLANVEQRLHAIVSMISHAETGLAPEARLIVAQIVPIANGEKDARVQAYNTVVASVVSQHRGQGENVRLVDMHSALTLSDLNDALHPNDAGYAKMAQVWFDGIMAP